MNVHSRSELCKPVMDGGEGSEQGRARRSILASEWVGWGGSGEGRGLWF
jgi:hypothetical protein